MEALLYSEAAVVAAGLCAGGMWSLMRGLARQAPGYQHLLQEASATDSNVPNDRSNLLQFHLLVFCCCFLQAMLGDSVS